MNEPIKYFKKLCSKIENIAAKKGIKTDFDSFEQNYEKKRS